MDERDPDPFTAADGRRDDGIQLEGEPIRPVRGMGRRQELERDVGL